MTETMTEPAGAGKKCRVRVKDDLRTGDANILRGVKANCPDLLDEIEALDIEALVRLELAAIHTAEKLKAWSGAPGRVAAAEKAVRIILAVRRRKEVANRKAARPARDITEGDARSAFLDATNEKASPMNGEAFYAAVEGDQPRDNKEQDQIR